MSRGLLRHHARLALTTWDLPLDWLFLDRLHVRLPLTVIMESVMCVKLLLLPMAVEVNLFFIPATTLHQSLFGDFSDKFTVWLPMYPQLSKQGSVVTSPPAELQSNGFSRESWGNVSLTVISVFSSGIQSRIVLHACVQKAVCYLLHRAGGLPIIKLTSFTCTYLPLLIP